LLAGEYQLACYRSIRRLSLLSFPAERGENKVDEHLNNDSYSLFVPIEDHDLLKSVSIDENGDYIVQGVMTSDAVDEEDDSITPEGMDCSYFLTKGWIKYEHGNKPEQFIGEPIEVKVGRFEHPTLMKSVNGIFVKGRLFAQRSLTKSAIEAMNDLQKSNTKRRMGWSIEGNVKKRNDKGKIVKSVLRNVVLTMNPVNTTTWAELAKSFAKDHELDIDMEKAMDIAGAAEITPQSLEGSKKKKTDPQDDWINHFRDFVKKALVEKSFRSTFTRSAEDAELLAFGEAIAKGLDMEEADEFASYIAGKHTLLKSLVINFGGENMSAEAENKLASLLDADLEELKKSIELEDEEEDFEDDEELEKAIGEDEDDSEGDDEETGDEGEEEEEGDDDEDDEHVQKSIGSNLRKSLAEEHGQAFEVSDFLSSIADEIGYGIEGMEKSLMNVTKQNNAIVKALGGFGEVMQKALDKIESLEAQNDELTKSLSEVMNRPVGRKGVVNQREVQTLSKSVNTGGQAKGNYTRSQISDILVKSAIAGDIPNSAVSRFEAGVSLQNLGLSADYLQKSFGM
jgi:hypothetical protein